MWWRSAERAPVKRNEKEEPKGSSFFLLFDFNGVNGTAVGGSGGPVVLGLVGLRQDGGDAVLHAEDAWGGVGAHTASDAAGGVHGDGHEKNLRFFTVICSYYSTPCRRFQGDFSMGREHFFTKDRLFYGVKEDSGGTGRIL